MIIYKITSIGGCVPFPSVLEGFDPRHRVQLLVPLLLILGLEYLDQCPLPQFLPFEASARRP